MALETFNRLDAGVRSTFADEIGRLDITLRQQFRRLDGAIEADTFRSIAEEARLLRQEISRLRHRPKLREHMIRAELYQVEAESRALVAILSQADRSQFGQQQATAEQALTDGRFALADRAIEGMREILMSARRLQPGYAAAAFSWLQTMRHLSSDPTRYDELVSRGRTAAMSGNDAELRQICNGIARTLNLPQDREVDVAALAGLRR